MGCLSSKVAEIEHPDIIKAEIDDVHKGIEIIEKDKEAAITEYERLRKIYVTYIGEEQMLAIEQNTIFQDVVEPKFSRQFVNTKDSKILRDISAAKKLIHDLQLKIEDRRLDMSKLNVRLAQSMSLTSAHGQVHYMRLERDAVIEEREKLKQELVAALQESKTNLLRKLASAPFMLLRFKEWTLKYFIPGPDPRNRTVGCQERLVSAFIVEPSSPESFLALVADLAAHRGTSTNYGFALTSKAMLNTEWGFVDPMPIHGTHVLDGRQDTVFEDIADIGADEVILLGFHYNRFRTNVVQQGAFKLPETTYDHYEDKKHLVDLVYLQAKIAEIPGIICTLSEDRSKNFQYSLKVIRTSV